MVTKIRGGFKQKDLIEQISLIYLLFLLNIKSYFSNKNHQKYKKVKIEKPS